MPQDNPQTKLGQILTALDLMEHLTGYVDENDRSQLSISTKELENTIKEQLDSLVPQESLRYEELVISEAKLKRIVRIIKTQLEPLSDQFSAGFVKGLSDDYDKKLQEVTGTIKHRHEINQKYLEAKDIDGKIESLGELKEGEDLPDVPDVSATLIQLRKRLERLESDKSAQEDLDTAQLHYQRLKENTSQNPEEDIKEIEFLINRILEEQPDSVIAVEATLLKLQMDQWKLQRQIEQMTKNGLLNNKVAELNNEKGYEGEATSSQQKKQSEDGLQERSNNNEATTPLYTKILLKLQPLKHFLKRKWPNVYTIYSIIFALFAVFVVLLFVVLVNLFNPSGSIVSLPSSTSIIPTPIETSNTDEIEKFEDADQNSSADATPTPKQEQTTPTDTPEPKKVSFRVCVVWQDGDSSDVLKDIIDVLVNEVKKTYESGCLSLSDVASVGEKIQIEVSSRSNLKITGLVEENGWQRLNNESGHILTKTVTEGMPDAEFAVVIPEREFTGQVTLENQTGIEKVPIKLERKTPNEAWQQVGEGVVTGSDGNFSITDTDIGRPDYLYRLVLADLAINRQGYIYQYQLSDKPPTPSIWTFVSSDKALESKEFSISQIDVAEAKFQLNIQHVVLPVDAATITPDPATISIENVSGTSLDDETQNSKLVTLDANTVNTLQARWDNVALPAGTYRLEIWTPEGADGKATYTVSLPNSNGTPELSSQSVRDKNIWVDSSSEGLFWENTIENTSISVVIKPSQFQGNSSTNGEVFGIGPVRLVKQP